MKEHPLSCYKPCFDLFHAIKWFPIRLDADGRRVSLATRDILLVVLTTLALVTLLGINQVVFFSGVSFMAYMEAFQSKFGASKTDILAQIIAQAFNFNLLAFLFSSLHTKRLQIERLYDDFLAIDDLGMDTARTFKKEARYLSSLIMFRITYTLVSVVMAMYVLSWAAVEAGMEKDTKFYVTITIGLMSQVHC